MQLFECCKYRRWILNNYQSSFSALHQLIRDDVTIYCYFETVNIALNHPGFTFLYYYTQYAQTVVDSYSHTQFMEHYNWKHKEVKGYSQMQKNS